MDDAIRRRIWQGKLNIEVSLASGSKTSGSNGGAPKYYFQAYRNSYLPLYYDTMLQFFEPYIEEAANAAGGGSGGAEEKENDFGQKRNVDRSTRNSGGTIRSGGSGSGSASASASENKVQSKDVWLSFEDIPLKWNYPVGLLYDCLNYDAASEQEEPGPGTAAASAAGKFWKLTLHFENYPSSQIIPLQSPLGATVEQHWVNQIKESCYVQHGSAKPVMSLSKKDSDAMWQYAQHCDYDRFKTVYFRKVVPRRASELRNVPVKVYLPFSEKSVVIMDPVRPTVGGGGGGDDGGDGGNSSSGQNGRGTAVTLQDLLARHLPDLFGGEGKGRRGGRESVGRALVQGVEVPLQAPLAELYYAMMSVDGFLHVCVAVGGGGRASSK